MVHERTVDGQTMEMGVSGKVKLGNLIMFDRESGTEWLQETGEALQGEQQGKRLEELDSALWEPRIRWDEWHEKHPTTQVLFCGHCEDQ